MGKGVYDGWSDGTEKSYRSLVVCGGVSMVIISVNTL